MTSPSAQERLLVTNESKIRIVHVSVPIIGNLHYQFFQLFERTCILSSQIFRHTSDQFDQSFCLPTSPSRFHWLIKEAWSLFPLQSCSENLLMLEEKRKEDELVEQRKKEEREQRCLPVLATRCLPVSGEKVIRAKQLSHKSKAVNKKCVGALDVLFDIFGMSKTTCELFILFLNTLGLQRKRQALHKRPSAKGLSTPVKEPR